MTFNGANIRASREPLVDAATWASVQDILVSRRNGERFRTYDHYLKGTVYCIGCGYRLILQHTRAANGCMSNFLCRRGNAGCPRRKVLPVEQRVADSYRNIELTIATRVHRGYRPRTPAPPTGAGRRPCRRTQPRSRPWRPTASSVVDAYHADAVPRSLFLSEQRIREALDVLQDAHATYEQSAGHIRRQLNRALFARVLLGP